MSQRKRLSNTQTSQSKEPRPQRTDASHSAEEDDDVTLTQPTTSQVQRGLDRLTPAQVDQKMAEVVQYFLVKDQKKIPIRRADIVKHVLKEYRGIYPEILRRAASTFEQVFGLKLIEIDQKNHVYILINKLETAEGAPLSMSSCNPKMGLLFLVLAIVFMKGGVVKESLIWNMLKKLRIDPGEKHEVFGDVKRLVTDEFVRQRYLEYVRVPHTEPIEYDFHWGQRADIEVSKIKILEFIGQLHDQEPQSWSQQYKEATKPAGDSNSQAGTSSQR